MKLKVVAVKLFTVSAAADSVDSNLFYAVIHLPVRSKTYIKLSFLK